MRWRWSFGIVGFRGTQGDQALTENEEAQVIHYLKATGLNRALLFNFASRHLEYKRLVVNLRSSALICG
jgi:hypothetical protein